MHDSAGPGPVTSDTDARPAAPLGSLVAGLAAFCCCLALTPAFPGSGDAGEFTLALALRGVPHPTGYPLYVLTGHLWVAALHAAGLGWAHAANTWSAAGAGVACGLLHALTLRLLPSEWPRSHSARTAYAALPAALLLFDRAFLRDATIAEVTSWQVSAVLGVALAVLLTLQALARPDGRLGEGELRRRLFFTGLALGAALSHHATSVLYVLPAVVALRTARARAGRTSTRTTLFAWAGVALPMLSWAHVPWRAWHPAAFQWPLLEPSWGSVAAHVTGRIFGAYFGGFAPRPAEAALLLEAVAPFAAPGLAIAAWLALRGRMTPQGLLFGALTVGSLLQLFFVFNYGVPDSVPYFLPVLAVALLALAVWAAPAVQRMAGPVVVGAAMLALAFHAYTGVEWSAAQHRADARVAAAIRARWDSLPFGRGIVLWNSDHYTHLVILGVLERRRPGLVVDNPAMLTWEPARRAFEKRTGVDPLAGLELRDDSDLPRIPANVARQTPLPVVDFATWSR